MAKVPSSTEQKQSRINNAAAEGNRARKTPPKDRTPDDVKAIKRFLKTVGTPTKSWEAEEKRMKGGK